MSEHVRICESCGRVLQDGEFICPECTPHFIEQKATWITNQYGTQEPEATKERRDAFWRAAFLAAMQGLAAHNKAETLAEYSKEKADAALALAIEERKV